ncbi:uncharacterized protein LOC128715398 [Anopheles marshallii]|uniref:uncharacterized protein LOC128715398 n=1 Tax=Anopheles marshallii TaxID=1521116 RepID=UPI00237AF624|nr:uncharacterized protein LOC128715398 [Anopheles marshallii]
MGELTRVLLFTIFVLVVISPQQECSPLFFYTRPSQPTLSGGSVSSASVPEQRSNVTIALGNRINTDTALDDYGTRVDGVTVNVARRRRDIWSIPSILGPNTPNGSYIAINNQVIPLPDNLSNVSLNIGSLPNPQPIFNTTQPSSVPFLPTIPENYTNAFQSLVTGFETLPLDFMDNIVRTLSSGYRNSFGQLFLEQSFERLNRTLEYGGAVVRNGLNSLVNQTGQGFEELIANFNGSSTAVQRCIGNNLNPTNVVRSVVDKGYNCVNRKWQDLKALAGNIGEDIVAADKGASEFLANLTACNGANFNSTNNLSTSQQNTLRRQCYVRTIVSFPQPLLFLPVSLAIDGTKLYASISGLEADIGACAAEVALEIGMTTAQISTKIVLCQIFS